MSHTFSDGQTLCPYNPSHVISSLRAIPHLAKCRLQHPDLAAQVAICPYNQGHHIPNEQLQTHLQTCPDFCAMKSVAESASQLRKAPNNPAPPRSPLMTSVDDEELSEWM